MIRGKPKIPSDYGMTDYYKYYNNNGGTVNKAKYNKVVSEVNNSIIEAMLNDNLEYNLPTLGLTLTIRKDKRKPSIKNGKLYNPTPIDWVKTRKLWDSNKEAKKNKVLVRYLNNHTNGYIFRIYCKKFGARLKNRSIYKFKPSRNFQRSLSKRIKNLDKDKFDAFLLYKE